MFGARLVVAKPEGHKDTDYLTEIIYKEKITFKVKNDSDAQKLVMTINNNIKI